ncbi:hypothetical protein [Brevibacterium aurantiacum]|uniref:hypothetical protein n=1 Tax=Brevibacterium aurantiacum TaxID=273384 RepID=UPI0016425D92|nr:hypothetical protein [Brevibacterium aurantiacum]
MPTVLITGAARPNSIASGVASHLKAEVMNSVEAVHELEDRGLFFDVTSGLAG